MSNLTLHNSLIESFCAFIEFQADRFQGWVIDPRLQRNMNKRLQQSSETSEQFWALYWHKRWQGQAQSPSQALERAHLIAHLQEPCYWAAHKAARYLDESRYSVSDCFQLLLIHIDRVFRGFKAERGASLKGYAKMALPCLIRDILRQRQDAHLCSNWSLLRRVSKRQLTMALKQAGLLENAIAEYHLAWVCYKACNEPQRTGQGKSLKSGGGVNWEAIAELYNQERLSQLSGPGDRMTPQALEKRLSQVAVWVRALLYPPMTSLNASKPNVEGVELQDSLSDSEHESLMGELIAREEAAQRHQQQGNLNQVLEAAIAALPPENQRLLLAYYQEKLAQREIAEMLAIKQYTVSRRLARIRESLVRDVSRWSQETLHISLEPDQVSRLSATLEDWLDQYYGCAEGARSLASDACSDSPGAP